MSISPAEARAGLLALALLLAPGAAAAAEGGTVPGGGVSDSFGSIPVRPGGAARFEARELGEPGLDSGGWIAEIPGGFGPATWTGTDPALIRRLLPRLPITDSPGLRNLTRRLLLSSTPAAAGGATAGALLEARVERLAALGDNETVATLVRTAPASQMSPALIRARIESLLLGGDLKSACSESLSRRYDEPRLKVLCALVDGRMLEANMALDMMRERKDSDPVFLLAAEAMGGVPPARLERVGPLSPVTLAACRAGRLPLPPDAVAGAAPILLSALAANPVNPVDTRLAAAERVEALGLSATETLRNLYTDLFFTPAETQDAEAQGARSPRGRALLWRTIPTETHPARRAEALAKVLAAANGPEAFAATARLYTPLLTTLVPGPDLGAQAAPLARALVVLGRADLAGPWLNLAYGDPSTVRQAKTVALLRRLLRPGDEPGAIELPSAEGLPPEIAARRAEVILSLLRGVGEPIPSGPWLASLRDPLLAPSVVPRPGLDALAEVAAAERRIGETVLLTLVELGEAGGFARADPVLLGAAVDRLRQVGLEPEARALAVEIALANGW